MARDPTSCFQFLGIPPKGELYDDLYEIVLELRFPISRDPPEGGTLEPLGSEAALSEFPISRDPPEGGTLLKRNRLTKHSPGVSNF